MNQIVNVSGALSAAQGLVSGLMWIIIIALLVTKVVKFKIWSMVLLFVGGGLMQYLIYHYTQVSTIISKIVNIFV
ncbi:hypothetical protein [Listeria fleischmannii]|uniref:Uncharacterized protein n=1 Tax=Listeria fleischmannii FSL S10-1203 TaxID=1265822 RepID=W7D890_9LIST|nr:hypothetical protein [Listeria fleischmannii]EUJ48669.1 hypothetical protein MCOL2_17017 [Listeria fleischmannii FSL S10-1203]